MRSSWLTCTVLLLGLASASCFRHPLVEDGNGATGSDTAVRGDGRSEVDGDGAVDRVILSTDGLKAKDAEDGGPDVLATSDTALDAILENPDLPVALADGPLSDGPQPTTDSWSNDIPITSTGGSSGTGGQPGTGAGGSGGTRSQSTTSSSGLGGGATTPDAQGIDGTTTDGPVIDAPVVGGAGTGGSSTGGSNTGGAVTGGSSTGGSSTGGSSTSVPLPVTTIATYPANPTNVQDGAFTFSNTSASVTYKCKLDASAFAPCSDSYLTPALADGSHTLIVQATDSGGRVESAPPSYTWVIDTVAPDTNIVTRPDNPSMPVAGSFTFGSSGETLAVTYECKLDAGDFTTCDASYLTPVLAMGTHTLSVRAKDAAGNADPTPASTTWEIVPVSEGCGKTPTLNNSPDDTPVYNAITSGTDSRQYLLRYPANYNNTHPYRLVIGYHMFTSSAAQLLDCKKEATPCSVTKSAFYGLWNLANDSTIFIAPDGINGAWNNTGGRDLVFTDDILNQVEKDLCIDKTRVFANGFSMGASMTYAIACDRVDVFRGVAVYSGANMSGCLDGKKPIAYYASHGVGDATVAINMGRGLRDKFVANNHCTTQTPPEPTAGSGIHLCTTYSDCSSGHPVVWCAFDGNHTPSPLDQGQTNTWLPQSAWNFLTQF